MPPRSDEPIIARHHRLYLDDATLTRFEGRVVQVSQHRGVDAVVLDRSAFYPEAGGQMADHGELTFAEGHARVVDVQLVDGLVAHLIEGQLPPVGSTVAGRIDERRRRLHRALHTGQHILSRALLDVAAADTSSARLGETACTIDVDRERIDEGVLGRVEELANDVVDADLEVRAFYPDEAELSRLALRKASTVQDDVRVVKIGDFDVTPCGGTHCSHTSQVGLVTIARLERHKRRLRIHFAAGPRGRAQLAGDSRLLRALARELSCGSDEVAASYAKLTRELASSREEAKRVSSLLAQQIATSLAARSTPQIAVLEGVSATVLREVAAIACGRAEAVVLLACPVEDGLHIVVARGSSGALDCGAFVRDAAARFGRRGGGRPDRAEGKLPADCDWPALAAELLA